MISEPLRLCIQVLQDKQTDTQTYRQGLHKQPVNKMLQVCYEANLDQQHGLCTHGVLEPA